MASSADDVQVMMRGVGGCGGEVWLWVAGEGGVGCGLGSARGRLRPERAAMSGGCRPTSPASRGCAASLLFVCKHLIKRRGDT